LRRDEEGGGFSVEDGLVLCVSNLGPQKNLAAFHPLDSGQNLDLGATRYGALVIDGEICCEPVASLCDEVLWEWIEYMMNI
jgi:hypothetical protein